jgi:hypothetical protein
MRSVLQLTVLALAFVVTASFGTFAPTHEVSADGAVTRKDSFSVTLPPNPCNPESGNLTGTINFVLVEREVFDESGNFVHYNANYTARGEVTDANGLKYNYKQTSHSIIHDDLPYTFKEIIKVTSQGGGDNFEFVTETHVNEQGVETKVDPGSGECKG